MSKKTILNITSKYDLKKIFSYVDFSKTLNIIKYNKSLQGKIDISLKNYNLDFEYRTIKKRVINDNIDYKKFNILCIICCASKLILLIFQLIYSLSFLFKYHNNPLEIEKSKFSLIFGFNFFLCNFFYIYIIISIFLLLIELLPNSECSWSFIIIDLILYIFVFIMLFVILKINYEIENDKFTWLVILALILIILYGIVICFIVSIIIFFLTYIEIKPEYFLNKFKGIKINEFQLNNNFPEMSPTDQKHYLIENCSNFIYKNNEEQNELIDLINDIRKNKYIIPILKKKNKIPNIFIKENSKVVFSLETDNFIEIKSKIYLFKESVKEFKEKLINNNDIILRIISMEQLNRINILKKDNIEYILIYDNRGGDKDYNTYTIRNNFYNIGNSERVSMGSESSD